MQSSKMMRALVLIAGIVAGYFAISGLSRAVRETTNTPKLATSQDETCSTASTETAACEMPGEMSRADYLRSVIPADRAPAGSDDSAFPDNRSSKQAQ